MDSRQTIRPLSEPIDRWSDAESYARRVMEVPVQSCRREPEANPGYQDSEGRCGAKMLVEGVNAQPPRKASREELKARTENRHR